MADLEHRPTDPMCIKHEPPRTWWQRRKFNRGRGLACIECRFGTRVTSPADSCGAASEHEWMRDREHLAVCPVCNLDLTTPLPPAGGESK